MFPDIKIITDKKAYINVDIIKTCENQYDYYFRKINNSLNKFTNAKFNFISNFKYKNVHLWYSNNLFERNIYKSNLINNSIIVEFINELINKKEKVILVELSSFELFNIIKDLGLEVKLKKKIIFSNFKKKNYLIRTFIIFIKYLVKYFKSYNKNNYFQNLYKYKNIFFAPYESKMNSDFKYEPKISGSFYDQLGKKNNRSVLIHYLPDIDDKFNNKLFSKLNKTSNKNLFLLDIEFLKFSELLLGFLIYLKISFSYKKKINFIKNYLISQNQKHIFSLYVFDLMETFKGPLLFKNIIDVIIFKKINEFLNKNANIFYFYENQYWEKTFIQSFKNFKTIGLLDTPPKLWDSSLIVDYNSKHINEKLFPNFLLYSSPIYSKFFIHISKNSKTKLIPIESFRYTHLKFKNSKSINKIFIFGDGHEKINNFFLKTISKFVNRMSNYDFYYRKHPSIKKDNLLKINTSYNFNKDLSDSSFAIMTNSTNSYLESIFNKKIPFIFKDYNTINRSVLIYTKLRIFFFKNDSELFHRFNQLNKIKSNYIDKKLANSLILIDNSFLRFEKFYDKYLI